MAKVLVVVALFCGVHGVWAGVLNDDLLRDYAYRAALTVCYRSAMDELNRACTDSELCSALVLFVHNVCSLGMATIIATESCGVRPVFGYGLRERGQRAWLFLLRTRAVRKQQLAFAQTRKQRR